MSAALKFLLAAKRCEIRSLEQLAATCELVSRIGQLVHVLQRERGASSIFIASRGARFGDELARKIADCLGVEAAVRASLDELETDSRRTSGGVRLFSRIAWVLNGLDALPELRAHVRGLTLSSEQTFAAFTKLIGGLLAVVFEAADTAADPRVSRTLVALFNFMQGKELAGQERATGAAGFAAGSFDAAHQQRLVHLIDAQQRCFDIFADFAGPELCAYWREALPAAELAEFERLRRRAIAPLRYAAPLRNGGETWFELATRRIDAMKQVEDRLAAELSALCEHKTVEARAELDDHANILASLSSLEAPPGAGPVAMFYDQPGQALAFDAGAAPVGVFDADAMSPQLGRSILDLLHAHARRLQQVSDELDKVRTALNERKVIERAKGLLMTHRGLSEDQAYKMLRQTAMDQGRRLADVADTVLSVSGLLKHGERARKA